MFKRLIYWVVAFGLISFIAQSAQADCAAREYRFAGACRTEAWVRATFEPSLRTGEKLEGIVGATAVRSKGYGYLGLVVSSNKNNKYKITTFVVSSNTATSTLLQPSFGGYKLSDLNTFEYGAADRAWCTDSGDCSAAGIWYTSLTESVTTDKFLPLKTESAGSYYGFASKWITCEGTTCQLAIAGVSSTATPESLCAGMIDNSLRKAAQAGCQTGLTSRFTSGEGNCALIAETVANTTGLNYSCAQILFNSSDLSGVVLSADSNHPMGAENLNLPAIKH